MANWNQKTYVWSSYLYRKAVNRFLFSADRAGAEGMGKVKDPKTGEERNAKTYTELADGMGKDWGKHLEKGDPSRATAVQVSRLGHNDLEFTELERRCYL